MPEIYESDIHPTYSYGQAQVFYGKCESNQCETFSAPFLFARTIDSKRIISRICKDCAKAHAEKHGIKIDRLPIDRGLYPICRLPIDVKSAKQLQWERERLSLGFEWVNHPTLGLILSKLIV
jgi:hypothetical protein